jgi:predicted metalloendopeptidase
MLRLEIAGALVCPLVYPFVYPAAMWRRQILALTLGENVADNAGLAIAERAYRLSLDGCPAAVIDGYSGMQRLFISFAQIWQNKIRDAAQIRTAQG